TGKILEQYCGAGSSAGETADLSWARLWQLLDGPTNTGRLRGDGNDQERAGSKHRRQPHQGPGGVHRRAVRSRRLRGGMISLAADPPPKTNVATEPGKPAEGMAPLKASIAFRKANGGKTRIPSTHAFLA